MENLRPHNQYEGGICAKKGEDVPIVQRRERGGVRLHPRTTEERVH